MEGQKFWWVNGPPCLRKRLQVLDQSWSGKGWDWGRETELQRRSVYSFSSVGFVSLPLEGSKVTGQWTSSGHQDSEHDILLR